MVELGEHDISGKTELMATNQIKVKRVVVHRDYKAPTFENDIAILELEESIRRAPHIIPICMPEKTDEVFEGRVGIVSGWGRLEYGRVVQIRSFQTGQRSALSVCKILRGKVGKNQSKLEKKFSINQRSAPSYSAYYLFSHSDSTHAWHSEFCNAIAP